jgi:hypothetical protein
MVLMPSLMCVQSTLGIDISQYAYRALVLPGGTVCDYDGAAAAGTVGWYMSSPAAPRE